MTGTRENQIQRRLDLVAYLAAFTIGISLTFWLIPIQVLLGLHSTEYPVSGDIGAHAIGQRYFLAGDWRWPLFTVPSLGYPTGISIAFTDSNPLELLFLKLVRGWLPHNFEGLHLWLGLCYVLQPISAVYALRGTGERRVAPAISIAIMALAMPVLWFRIGHAALSSHFLLLLALGLYLRSCRERRPRQLAAMALLPSVAMLIHPYLFAMVVAMMAASPVSLLFRGSRGWISAAIAVGGGIAVSGFLAWLFGYGDALPIKGFGAFSMNMISPVFPEWSGLFPGHLAPYAMPEQRDGYNYLGAGLIGLAAFAALWSVNQEAIGLVRRHAGLLFVCILLTLLSLSNHGYFGQVLVFDLGVMPGGIEQFRGSGRLFWPVAYVLLVTSIAIAARMHRFHISGIALLISCCLQVLDTTPLRYYSHDVVNERAAWHLNPSLLRPILVHYTRLRIRPIFGCGGGFGDAAFRDLAELASEDTLPVDTAWVARETHLPNCSDQAIDELHTGELRVFMQGMTSYKAIPNNADVCRRYRDVVLCTLRKDDLASLENAGQTGRLVRDGDRLSIGTDGNAQVLGNGWCHPDAAATWTCSSEAHLLLDFGGSLRKPASITLWGQAMGPRRGQPQHVTISVEHRVIATFEMPDLQQTTLTVRLPTSLILKGTVDLQIDIAQPTAPSERNINGDTRSLGLWLSALKVSPNGI